MICRYKGFIPQISDKAFVAPTATIIGDVVVEEGASIWFGAVLRGDIDKIRIGKNSSIQDNTVIHVTGGKYPTIVGDNVIVGHGCILHGCEIKNRALIGMGAIVMDDVVIGENSIVAAGAVVIPHTKVPPNSVVAGIPARVIREVKDSDLKEMERILGNYSRVTKSYLSNDFEVIE
ncbi:conserved hypothetical protein [Thermotomaculum hydrothermale]|uniref:Gamma carbonic anhydrase family protein n=1 Tax=Thermotomaculum hydrothermale TaxID=981385 RepID=A0A7R6SYV2_9BACT|nr:gamma carbonic anhydrase family protein [Thermotomaculum hydrothermale]BBB32117.1 conserved hypothetical protein [Thermotomaculum hydrothermale]